MGIFVGTFGMTLFSYILLDDMDPYGLMPHKSCPKKPKFFLAHILTI